MVRDYADSQVVVQQNDIVGYQESVIEEEEVVEVHEDAADLDYGGDPEENQ